MIGWLKRYAARVPASVITDNFLIWKLLDWSFFKVKLVVVYRTMELEVETTNHWNIFAFVFDGEFREHRISEGSPREGMDFYRYVAFGQMWRAVTYSAPISLRYRKGDVRKIELFEARTVGEKIIDFAQWMTHDQIIFDSERPVWAITIGWGKPR